MRVQRCKGTQDLSPVEMVKFRRIESAFRNSCLKWGYEEVRTPTLEYLHLFTSAGTLTPSMLHKVYSFLDWDGWSGERVVLRPDVTIPVARFYIDKMEGRKPAKLFYVTNVFRFEETGTEARERWQCGAELIGAGSTTADVELIVLALEVLNRLGINGVSLKLSHAGLIRALLVKLGLSPGEQEKIFDQFLNGGVTKLADIKPARGKVNRDLMALLEMKGKSVAMLKNLKPLVVPDSPELEAPLDNFITVAELVAALGCDYQIDIDAGRGFEYYTGIIFQLFTGVDKVGGGGRYDALIPVLGGADVPASGFALYLDRLMERIATEVGSETAVVRVLIKAEPLAASEAFRIAGQLHEAGFSAEMDLGSSETSFRWRLDVRRQAPAFVLTDQVTSQRYTAKNASEILAILGEQCVGKNSPA